MSGTAKQHKNHPGERLFKRLRTKVGKAIGDYNMVEAGDRILVCLSGGKDSYAMLDLLRALQQIAPVSFELTALNLDQKQPGFPGHVLPDYLQALGQDFHILEQDTYSVVTEKVAEGRTMCGLCSRLRRGILYNYAHEHGYNKIALGHHMDDMVETLFLNLFHGSTLKAMPPKLRADDGRNIVIRPLAYCREHELEALAAHKAYPIIPCNLCGSQENLQRQNIKAMLAGWEKQQPGRVDNIFRGMQNIKTSQLADTALFDFVNLQTQQSVQAGEVMANAQERAAVTATEADSVKPINQGSVSLTDLKQSLRTQVSSISN